MSDTNRVVRAYERCSRIVTVALLVGAFAALGALERWSERHPTAAKALGAVVWLVLFWLFVRGVQWVGALL